MREVNPDLVDNLYWPTMLYKAATKAIRLGAALQNLLDFIERNEIEDERADDGDGITDYWRSGEFQKLIDEGKASLLS